MSESASHKIYLSLKALSYLALVLMLVAMGYAAWMSLAYFPDIAV